MANSRIHMSYSHDEKTPPNIFTDHDWVRHQHEKLLAEHGERFIVVYQEQVLGVGDTYEAALQNAESNLPSGDAEITPIVELLRKRQPFLRVRPSDIQLSARDNG